MRPCISCAAHSALLRRKREARMVHKRAEFAQRAHGLRAKQFNEKRFKEKAAMKKT